MASIYRLRVGWAGTGVVGPGLTTLFFDDTATVANITPAVNTFFTAIKSYAAPGITWTIPNGGDTIDPVTGALTGTWTSGGAYTVTSSSSGAFAEGVGVRIDWKSHIIRYGRRVRGAMYFCPIASLYLTNQGLPDSTMVTNIQTAANTLIASSGVVPVIWARPNAKKSHTGEQAIIDSAVVPTAISWLRSRRT